MNPCHSLTVDLGRTWLRASLSDAKGKVVLRRRLKAVPWRELPAALRTLLRHWNCGKLSRLTAGATGIWAAADRRTLARALRGLAKDIRVISDLELAHAAAFGDGPGILVIGSTGSVAFGRDEAGRTVRAGGLGPLLGDEGSAFWIGRRALKDPRLRKRFPAGLALRLAHSASPVRDTAKLSRAVFRWARRDKAAREIQIEAAAHLGELAAEVGRSLHFSGPVPLRWHGSLFKEKLFLVKFLASLKRKGVRFSLDSAR